MNDITTTDLADFGARERRMAEKLLEAWRTQSLPEDFFGDEVRIMMNRNSGNVFLTNSEFQVAMLNGDRLESFYSCPQCGHEGFKDEMMHSEGNRECAEFIRSIGAIRKRGRQKVH